MQWTFRYSGTDHIDAQITNLSHPWKSNYTKSKWDTIWRAGDVAAADTIHVWCTLTLIFTMEMEYRRHSISQTESWPFRSTNMATTSSPAQVMIQWHWVDSITDTEKSCCYSASLWELLLLHPFNGLFSISGWLGSRVVSVLDSGAEGPGFKSHSWRCRVTVLSKLFTTIVPLFTMQRNW